MIVTVLGSGSARPSARRSSAGYLVEWSGGQVLLDASAGTLQRALKAGLDPARLRAVVLSHFHVDHTGDLPALLWHREEGDVLTVAGPPGTHAFVEAVRAGFPEDWLQKPRVAGFDELARAESIAVTSFPAEHSDEAVCLRLELDGATLAYSGDTADGPGVRAALRGADLALLECTGHRDGHCDADDCAAICDDAQPARVLLTHIEDEPKTELPVAEDGLVLTA